MDSSPPQDISIIDKDESSEKAYHVVDGYVIEDSKTPFPNGQLSFVPEDYGKEKPSQIKRPRPPPNSNHAAPQSSQSEELGPGKYKCEFCNVVDDREKFMPPSRRFCSLSCCKRYSAEKRYYPYGRDEEGIAMSIRAGLLTPGRGNRMFRHKQTPNVREQRQRRMAYFRGSPVDESTPSETTSRRGRGRRGRRGRRPNSQRENHSNAEKQSPIGSGVVEPYSHPCGTPLVDWTPEDVGEFLTSLGYEAYIDRFAEHEIDGRALSLVRDHHLLMTMKLRLGPTLKICEHVNAIRAVEEMATDM